MLGSSLQAARHAALPVLLLVGVGFTLAPLSFEPHETPIAWNLFEALLVGDVDGDGYDDVAKDTNLTHLDTLLGSGDGTFGQRPVSYPIAIPWDLALVDVDRDRLADLVEVQSAFAVRVHTSLGDGSFAIGPSLATAPFPNDAAVADLDLDGVLDLAVACGDGGAYVTTWLGGADGIFHSPWTKMVNDLVEEPELVLDSPWWCAAGDLDGDGVIDLACSERYARLYWLNGAGDGTFTSAALVEPSEFVTYRTVDLADLDNDGWLDVVAASIPPGSPVTTVRGTPTGFANKQTSSVSGNARFHLPLGDFDADGWTDFASSLDVPYVASGLGDGTFAGPRPLASPAGSVGAVASGDLDGNGVDDLFYALETDDRLIALRNLSDGPVLPAVGQGLPGATLPRLVGVGVVAPGSGLELRVTCGPPGGIATLVLGASLLSVPFRGGTLVPSPDLLLSGLVLDGEGALLLPVHWPIGLPSGTSVWMQAWLPDAAAPAGLAATNGVRATQP